MKYFQKRTNVRFLSRLLERISPALASRILESVFFTVLRRRPTPGETAILSRAHRDWVLVGRRRVARFRWGTPGPTAMLVHGWAGDAAQMTAFVQPLVDLGYQVVAYDAPAHGASPGRRTHLPELIATLQTLTHTDRPRVLVAHSLGTVAATAAMAEGLAVDRAVFLAPVDDPWSFLALVRRWLGLSSASQERMQRRVLGRLGITPEDLVTSRRARALASPERPAPPPALLAIHDTDDRQVGADHARRLVEAWPGARLELTRGLGHTRILTSGPAIALALAFVRSGTEEGEASIDDTPSETLALTA